MNSKTILMAVGTLVVLVIVVMVIFAGENSRQEKNTMPENSNTQDNTENATNDALNGTKWVLSSFEKEGSNVQIPEGAEVTLEFQEDGRFGGRAACNNYFGSFAFEEQGIVVSPIGSTQMACEEPLMNLEFEYLQVLQTTNNAYKTGNGELVLQSGTLQNSSLTFIEAE